jgi:hypothetical protein
MGRSSRIPATMPDTRRSSLKPGLPGFCSCRMAASDTPARAHLGGKARRGPRASLRTKPDGSQRERSEGQRVRSREGDVPGLAARRRQCAAKPCGTSDRPRQESSFVRPWLRDPCEAVDVVPCVRSVNAIACHLARRCSLVTNGSIGNNRADRFPSIADRAKSSAKCLTLLCLEVPWSRATSCCNRRGMPTNAPLLVRRCRALKHSISAPATT